MQFYKLLLSLFFESVNLGLFLGKLERLCYRMAAFLISLIQLKQSLFQLFFILLLLFDLLYSLLVLLYSSHVVETDLVIAAPIIVCQCLRFESAFLHLFVLHFQSHLINHLSIVVDDLTSIVFLCQNSAFWIDFWSEMVILFLGMALAPVDVWLSLQSLRDQVDFWMKSALFVDFLLDLSDFYLSLKQRLVVQSLYSLLLSLPFSLSLYQKGRQSVDRWFEQHRLFLYLHSYHVLLLLHCLFLLPLKEVRAVRIVRIVFYIEIYAGLEGTLFDHFLLPFFNHLLHVVLPISVTAEQPFNYVLLKIFLFLQHLLRFVVYFRLLLLFSLLPLFGQFFQVLTLFADD